MLVLWLFFGFIIGSIIGSLAQALAERSLKKVSFLGRSYCPKCKNAIRWYDLFPVLSYVLLKGRCRFCHQKIGVNYLWVEIFLGLLIAMLFGQSLTNSPPLGNQFKLTIFFYELVFKIYFITVLAVVTLTDLKKNLIPDKVMIPAIIITFASLVAVTVYKIWYLYYYLAGDSLGRFLLPPHNDYLKRHIVMIIEPIFWSILLGIGIAGFFLLLIMLTRGKGMGGGDVKLGAFIGLGLGFPLALLAVLLAFLSGAVVAVGLVIMGKKSFGQTIPFGPFLVLGSLTVLFWGNQILKLIF
ncbi:prepilin peptidase [Candidatus Daviesbacteria bacterium]|nr:prepilin peptidase [Candidatus Daviesbacteria bacterium]